MPRPSQDSIRRRTMNMFGSRAVYQTQLRILTGRELAAKVVARLKLASVPEFNGQGAQRTSLASVLDTMKRQVYVGIARITGGDPPMLPSARVTKDAAALVNNFLGAVTVDPVRGSRLYNVSVTSADPEFAARAADTLVEEYVKQNFERRTERRRRAPVLADEIQKQQLMSRQRARDGGVSRTTTRCRRSQNPWCQPRSVTDHYTRTLTERSRSNAVHHIKVRSPTQLVDACRQLKRGS